MDKRNCKLTSEESKSLLEFISKHRNSVDTILVRLTMALGFKSKLYGSHYVREAVALYYKLPAHSRGCLSEKIYPEVALTLNTVAARVERDIRTAILDAYSSGMLFRFNELVGIEVISATYSPTNLEFISCVGSWLRLVISSLD